MPAAYMMADVVVSASIKPESFGRVAVESQAMGKPIIASFLGYKSMINESNCGSFIRPEDPKHLKDEIYKYFNLSKFELNKIGYNGKKWINSNRQYSMLASKYLKLIYDK